MDFLTYKQWDVIADAYIPILAILFLVFIVRLIFKKQFKLSATLLAVTGLSIVYVYGWMYLDIKLGIWPRIGWDYSTHTALAWALVWANVFAYKNSRIPVFISLGLYLGLMDYQNYHTWADMISTSLVIGPFVYWLFKKLK